MDTVRFFEDHSTARLKALRDAGDVAHGLQQVQHQVAVEAGYSSWRALLAADDSDRALAAVMVKEPQLNDNGMGAGSCRGTAQGRRERFAVWRAELRESADHVEQVRAWLEQNIEPRKTINPDAHGYSLKHIAEDSPSG